MGGVAVFSKNCIVSETGQDRTKAIDDQYKVAYELSIGTEINELG